MVEKARKNFDEDEIEILRRIYAEGREDGIACQVSLLQSSTSR